MGSLPDPPSRKGFRHGALDLWGPSPGAESGPQELFLVLISVVVQPAAQTWPKNDSQQPSLTPVS